MPTSFEAFSEETRQLALLRDDRPAPAGKAWQTTLAMILGALGGFVVVAILL